MVQINKLSPFQLKNFVTMIKICMSLFLVGLLFYFFSGEDFQRERSIFFCILFLFLLVIVTIGNQCFVSGKYEKMGLWLLYLSMMIATIGFPLLSYIIDISQSFQSVVYNCAIIFFASIIVNAYFILMRKYGRKFFSERYFIHVALLPLIVLLFIPVILISVGDNFVSTLLWCGIIALSITMIQYQRIGFYLEQKNMKRYGNSLDIVNKKKKAEKK